nr:hypothetical protein [Ktedonobacteraceae bacterium]
MGSKEDTLSDWISSKKAAELLTANSGHTVSVDYVRRLGNTGKLETIQIDERTKLYNRKGVEGYRVKERGDGSVRRAARRRRGQQQQKDETVA